MPTSGERKTLLKYYSKIAIVLKIFSHITNQKIFLFNMCVIKILQDHGIYFYCICFASFQKVVKKINEREIRYQVSIVLYFLYGSLLSQHSRACKMCVGSITVSQS